MSRVRPVSAPSCETAGIHLQVLGLTGDLHCSNCCCFPACVRAHLGPRSGAGNKGTAAGPRSSHLLSFLPRSLLVVVGEGEGRGCDRAQRLSLGRRESSPERFPSGDSTAFLSRKADQGLVSV